MFLPRGLILRHSKKFSACPNILCSFNDNLTTSCIGAYHPSIIQFPRWKSSKRNSQTLLPCRILNENCEVSHPRGTKSNLETHIQDKFRVLLNPVEHANVISSKVKEGPADSKSLQVSVVGIPNAGKSTLVNQLIGSNICPHSQKVHTTRQNVDAILTKGSVQVVFQVNFQIFHSRC